MRLPSIAPLAVIAATALLAIAPLAHADPLPEHGQVVSTPLGAAAGFATRAVVITAGTPVDYLNLDTIGHNVVSNDKDANNVPLFASTTVSSKSTPVVGVESLPAGTYGFHCSIHPNMTGSLVVQ